VSIYTPPPAVTDLAAIWSPQVAGVGTEAGVTLGWTAPTVTSGTLAGYQVYILLLNPTTGLVEPYLYTYLKKVALKDSSVQSGFTISAPPTTTFFPFAWKLPTNPVAYTYPIGNATSPSCYSFQVVTTILEDSTVVSEPAILDVFQPAMQGQNQVGHFNPRFTINVSNPTIPYGQGLYGTGFVQLLQQDTYEDIAASVEMILNTPIGWRTALPQFGVEDMAFGFVNPNAIAAQVRKWEPRGNIKVTSIDTDQGPNAPADQAKVTISIDPVGGV